MSMNIKSEHVHALAREAARVLDTSQTGAVEQALVELLERHRAAGAAGRRSRVDQVLGDLDARLSDADRVALRAHGELYDDLGLPA